MRCLTSAGRRRRERVRCVRMARSIGQHVVRVPAMVNARGAGLACRAVPAFAQVTLTPDSGQGPGGPQLQQLVNWGAGMALIACLGALVYQAVTWGWGSHQHNMARVQSGKEGVGRAALVAGVIAAGAALVNFAVALGSAVK